MEKGRNFAVLLHYQLLYYKYHTHSLGIEAGATRCEIACNRLSDGVSVTHFS